MEKAPASAPEEVLVAVESSSSKDQTHIVKGKRTKRQRVQSPSPIGRTNSSSGDKDNITNSNEYQDGLTEEEDVDTANCLILLAQGQSRRISPNQQDTSTDHHQYHLEGYKFNSRKLIETASNGTGKAGYYVYECKTCNRTFPSFQALGGHRASHKKPNNKSSSIVAAAAAEEKRHVFSSSDEELDGHYKNISSLPLQLNHSARNLNNQKIGGVGNNNKVHECSVCGAEFTSGQALGGHMRRHRSISTAVGNNNTALTLTPTTTMELESEQVKQSRKVLSLDLDLNLPPTTLEDNNHNNESKFTFASKQQQSPNIVLSAPALVDCHY